MSNPTPSPLHQGLRAARDTAPAGALLLAVAVAIVLGYYYVPPVTAALDRVAELKERSGLIFAMISTAIFGGIIPILMQQTIPATRDPAAWSRLVFLTIFWALKGAEIDLLYRGEAWLLGDNNEIGTIVSKVMLDQFVYCPLWAVPSMVLGYMLPDVNYNPKRLLRQVSFTWYRRRVVPVMLANWFVWVPAVAVIYCLKLPLQLPIQNLVLCLWAILVMLMVHRPASHPRDMLDV